jgi:hypothetical protein
VRRISIPTKWLNWLDSLERGLPQERAILQPARYDQVEKLVGQCRIEASQFPDNTQGGFPSFI